MKIISRVSKLILIATMMMNAVGDCPAEANVQLPLLFMANHGQTDASVKYFSQGKGYTLFLTSSETVMEIHKSVSSQANTGDIVRMKLQGANADPEFQGMAGNGQNHSSVMIKQVYPGIDMVYYGNKGEIEYDFIIAPGVNPGLIRMGFQGTKNIALDMQGNLILQAENGKLAFKAPVLYQETGNIRKFVDGSFVLAENDQVYFNVGVYDETKELIIDPTITAVTPNVGAPGGGNTVQITGLGFLGIVNSNGVTFGGTNATSYTVNSNTQITAIAPAHSLGTFHVVVTGPSGSSPLVPADQYTYFSRVLLPVINSVNPTQGPENGGFTVTILGWAFNNVTGPGGVTFGGTNATSYVVNSNTKITAIAPPHAPGIVDVVVTNSAGSSSLVAADRFTYTALAPAITALSPTNGPIAGGTSVVITGSDFASVTGASGVTFGGTNAAGYTIDSDTQITAISPAHAAGRVDVRTTSPAGTSLIVPSDIFTFNPPVVAPAPAVLLVNSFTPSQGASIGATNVVITGLGFTGVSGPSGVQFGGVNATSYVVDSDTKITAVSPAHPGGAVVIAVTNQTIPSTVESVQFYTYFLTPSSSTDSYIFPSPVRGNSAQIAYTLSGPGLVEIRIYNEIGNLVDTINDNKLAGPQSSTVNTERFASGVYIYLLSVEYAAGNTQNYARRKFVVAH